MRPRHSIAARHGLRAKSLLALLCAVALLPTTSGAGLLWHGRPDSRAYFRAYGPKSTIFVSEPTLTWEVWADGGAVTSATMLLNGTRVDACYDDSKRLLTYRPSRPLSPGGYKVECKVVVDDSLVVSKDWDFSVSTNAVATLPEPTQTQQEAIRLANAYRHKLGLPDFSMEPRLNIAAMAHTNYLVQNKRTGHYEKPGEPGFVGNTPSDRLEAFGFCGSSYECVTYNSGGLPESVRDLFDAPYHRIPFMQQGTVPYGSGFSGKSFTIKFGMTDEVGTTVSPANGEKQVPLSWDKNETPNPLRIHGIKGETGYPIVLAHFSGAPEKVKLLSCSLETEGQDVPVYVNSPENDEHLDNAIILLPKAALRPETTYSVRVVINTSSGEVSRAWSFTTAGAASARH